MSDAVRELRSGTCRLCGKRFVGMEPDEYNSAVSRHILDHDPADPDMAVVRSDG